MPRAGREVAARSADVDPDDRADGIRHAHGEQAAGDVAQDRPGGRAASEAGADRAGEGEGRSDADDRDVDPDRGRAEGDGEHRPDGADDEGEHRGAGGVPRVGQVGRVDAELGLGMRGQRVVGRELARDLGCQLASHPLGLVELGQLLELALGVLVQLLALERQERPLRVTLGADRDVLAGSHRHGTRGQGGDAREDDRGLVGGRTRDADDDAGGRHDAVVGAEDAGPEPVEARADVGVVRLLAVVAVVEGRGLVGRSHVGHGWCSDRRWGGARRSWHPPGTLSPKVRLTCGSPGLPGRKERAIRAPRPHMREDRDMSGIAGGRESAGDDLFRWMVAASPDGLWVFDGEGRTLFANARMAELLGRAPDEMVGFSVFAAAVNINKEQFRHHLTELATHGVPGDNLECSLLDAHGNRFWALVSHTPLVDDTGARRGWMHRVSEHSAQRKLLDQLAEAQSIAKIGSWEWDVETDLVSWSDELYRIYGLDRTGLTPTYEGFLARIHPDDRARVAEVVGAALESDDAFDFEARVVRTNGAVAWIRGQGLVTRDPEGRARRMGGTTQDITEKKESEEALGLVTAMATAANEAATLEAALPAVLLEVTRHTTWRPVVATFVDAGGVLSAPLRPAAGTESSAIPVEVGMDVAARAAATRSVVVEHSPDRSTMVAVPVVNEGRVACVLVLDILDLSKIEAGRLDLESVDFDPAAVLERSVALLGERARAKSLDLSVSHGPDVPFLVSGDPVRFGQVVANLTTNAVKFTDAGSVIVRLNLDRLTAAGPVLRVEVTDTGAGIQPEVRSRLFESFSQGDSSTTREYGGTGLGLAISRQIVTAFGGEIGVESEPGHGSTFWFTAAFEVASTRSVGRSQSQAAAVSGLRVLVVGADEAHRWRVEEQLTTWSMSVTSATSGADGLAQLDRADRGGSPIDVVVLDDPSAGAEGLQVGRMIRSDERFAGVRVVLACAHVPPPDVAVSKDAGVDAVLTAPVMPSSLFDAMADVVGRQLSTESLRPVLPPRGADGHLGTVLVVEDNEVNQLVAQGVLESLGYAVRLAGNGVEGVEAYRAQGSELVAVLMDCQMPQMDGYAATRAIRAREAPGQRLPVIAMTASAIAGERERCLQAGMDDFLTKPIDVSLLASTLRRWTGTDAAPRSAAAWGTGSAAGSEVLDLRRLDELRDLDPGDPSLLLRFIDRFRSGARQRLSDLVDARAEGDAEMQGRIAHGLKGTASNLGASALADLCHQIEDLGAAGRLADEALVARVEDEVDRAARALEEYAAALRR